MNNRSIKTSKRKAGQGIADDRGSAERILDAASDILSTEGYAAVSMRKVAAKVGLSQAAIYRHYRDKSDLVGSIVEKGYDRLRRNIESRIDPSGEPALLIAEGFRAYVAFACENSSLFKAVLLQDIGPSQVKVNALSPGVARQRRTFELLANMISRGVAEGSFAACESEITAQAVWTSMFGLAVRLSLESESADEAGLERRRLVVERQIEIILRGLRGN